MDSKRSKYSFEYPECWNNEDRMNAFFAPFRDRDVNDIFYDNKMKFWKELIQESCKDVGYFTVQDLNRAFTRKRRIPYCISKVVKDLLINGDVRTKEEFLASTPSESWKKWAVQTVVVNPLSWSLKMLKQTVWGKDENEVEVLDNTEYVHIRALKEKSEDLLSIADEKHMCNKVYVFEDLRQKIASNEDPITFNLCIHWLYITGAAVKMSDPKDPKRILVKLAEPGDRSKPITEQELAISHMQFQEEKLSRAIVVLETERDNLHEKAREFINQGKKESAKNCLRKKMDLEKRLRSQVQSLTNIQSLLFNVKDAEINNQVVDSFKYGLEALKSTYQEAGTTADNVADTMDEIKDMMENHEEIKETIGSTLSPIIDEAELEEELAELLSHVTPSTSPLSKLIKDLPAPPSGSPSSSPVSKENTLSSKMQKVRKIEAVQ